MRLFSLLILLALTPLPLVAQVSEANPEELQKIDVEEHLAQKAPLDLIFIDDEGKTGKLSEWFLEGKPVILTLFYSDCPMLCSLVLNGLQKSVNSVDFVPGEDYKLLSVSINPREGTERSKAARERFGAGLPVGSTPDAWRFFTGDSLAIKSLTEAVGFKYFYVEKTGEYAHAAVLIVLTPDGTISRYLYGIEYKPANVRLALLEASDGKIGNTVDRIILYCFHYDPASKGYVLLAGQLMKIGGVVTLLLMGVLLGGLFIRDKSKKSN